MLNISPISAFNDNYIWLLTQPGHYSAVIVDPGDATPVLTTLKEQQLKLAAILITHHHYDHTNGIRDLLAQYPESSVPVFGPHCESIPHCTHPLGDHKIDDTPKMIEIDALQLNFQIVNIPGHTVGHIAYYGHDALFCGDTLFTGGCGRLFEGTPEQMLTSLTHLSTLPDHTRIYCGHEYTQANLKFALAVEPNNSALLQRIKETTELRQRHLPTVPSTLLIEKRTNPFLRCHEETVQQAASDYAIQHGGQPCNNVLSTFTVIRQWKDHFA